MFQIEQVFNVLTREGLSTPPLFYFNNYNFTNKIYFLIQVEQGVDFCLEQIFSPLKNISFNDDNYFKVRKINIWSHGVDESRMNNVIENLSLNTREFPLHLRDGFCSKLNLIDLDDCFIILELNCDAINSLEFIDGILSELNVFSGGFKIVNYDDVSFKSIAFNSPKEQLLKIKNDMKLIQNLITDKFINNNGRLKGIRTDYLKANVNLLLTPMLHGFKDITSLENSVKFNLESERNKFTSSQINKSTSHLATLNDSSHNQDSTKNEGFDKHSFDKLTRIDKFKIADNLKRPLMRLQSIKGKHLVVNDIITLNYFSLLNLNDLSTDEVDCILDFKRKIENALKIIERKTVKQISKDKVNKENVSNSVVNTLIHEQFVEENVQSKLEPNNSSCFKTLEKIFENIDLDIHVKDTKSLDAFEFEVFNNRLIVSINTTHVFYNEIYKNSTLESKTAFNIMIGSFCNLSYLNVSEKVRKQDKLFFSRWSSFLEDLLLPRD